MPIDRLNLDVSPAEYSDDEDAHMVSLNGAVGSKLQIANQSVFVQRQVAPRASWEAEEHYLPGMHLEAEPCYALRWRSAVEALPAFVSARLFDERTWGSGGSVSPFDGHVAETGALSLALAFYTLAQWPPVGPSRNDIVILADVYDGGPFGPYAFQYRDDLDADEPWHAYPAAAGEVPWLAKGFADAEDDSSVYIGAWRAVAVGGSRDRARFRAPRLGHYDLSARYTVIQTSNSSFGFGIDETGSSDPVPASSDTATANQQSREHTQLALGPIDAGDYAQLMGSGDGNTHLRGLEVRMRPVKIA